MNEKKVRLLERNFELYWSGKEPEISDERFDQLVEELRVENPGHPLLSKLGLDVARGVEYVHETPMLSLNKVYSYKELESWVQKVSRSGEERFIVQYKFDGLAGKLVDQTLATRGNGQVGENISRHRFNIDLIQAGNRTPLYKIQHTNKAVLGEIVVTFQNFYKYRDAFGQDFAHPRNFVAGMINRKDPIPDYVRLDFVEYGTSPSIFFLSRELDERKWEDIFLDFGKQKNYPTDGLVVKLADQKYADSLGYTSHHPNGAMAFKFYGETGLSPLLDVEWSHGKGCLTPVAIIRPIKIGGVIISRVTMHNAKFVREKDIQIGDKLQIERAGEVIPHVVNRQVGKSRMSCLPNNCPTCGSPVIYKEPELVCSNPDCLGTKYEKIRSALDCFDIDGLGVTVIHHLFNMGFLQTPADIFRLTYDDVLKIPGFAHTSAKKLVQNIQAAKQMEEKTLLASLNTPGVRAAMYAKILKSIPFNKLISGVDFHILASLPAIGEIRAKAIKRSLHENKEYIADMLKIVRLKEPVHKIGKKICFTGKMKEPRSYYHDEALRRGYVPVESVTKDLDLLVVSSENWQSGKTKSAERLGVKIIALSAWESQVF